VQKVKVDGEGLVIQIDQLMKQNQINFSLLATIPTVLLLTFISVATKNLVANRILNRRVYDWSTLRQQILRQLRLIEQLLIYHSERPALRLNHSHMLVPVDTTDENGASPMSSTSFGELLSLIYDLKMYTNQLQSRRILSAEFNADIHQLTSLQLSVRQKRQLLGQLFHSYSFLVHG
jgi:hypothetical protein